MKKTWSNFENMESKDYVCGYCGAKISSEKGYFSYDRSKSGSPKVDTIYICHRCEKATFFEENKTQNPGFLFGKKFEVEIPELINNLYEESKRCYSVNAFTSVGLCCRKLLMHIAVDLGAGQGLKFIEYVNYLDAENYIPRNSKKWVDIIRTKGNEATHEIVILTKKEAEQLITFSSIIINLVYENELLLDGEENET